MNFLILGSLLFCFGSVKSAIIEREEQCGKCAADFDMKAAMKAVQDKVKAMEPMRMKGLGNCKTCEFTGAWDVDQDTNEKSCVFKNENGDIVRQATFEWRNISGQCDCDFGGNHQENIAEIASMLSDPIITECAESAIEFLINPKNFPKFDKLSAKDELQTCVPGLVKLFQTRNDMKKFKLGANWQKARIYAELHTNSKGESRIRDVKILHDDTKGILHLCEGPDPFIESCRCLMETDLIGRYFMTMLKAVLPCWIERESADYKDVVDIMAACKLE